MTDAQALSRWVAAEMTKLRAEPNIRLATHRYIDAISRMSAHDVIRLFAISLLTPAVLPDLDTIKDDAA